MSRFTGAPDNPVEVCPIRLPGREERANEAPIVDGEPLIWEMANSILPLTDVPFALYGHSFGGNIAMSLAAYLEGHVNKKAVHVFIGAAIPPGVENPLESEFKVTDATDALSLPESQMTTLLRRIGTPMHFFEDKDRFATMLPALRADLGITRHRLFPGGFVLQSPITAIAALDDHIYPPALIGEWKQFTRTFELKSVSGGHLFLQNSTGKDHLLSLIKETLFPNIARGAGTKQKTA